MNSTNQVLFSFFSKDSQIKAKRVGKPLSCTTRSMKEVYKYGSVSVKRHSSFYHSMKFAEAIPPFHIFHPSKEESLGNFYMQ